MSAICHVNEDPKVLNRADKILLMGNPNVGKSVFFSEITGISAVSSNYSGTTVSYMKGRVRVGGSDYTLVDVPGTYSLSPGSEAEAVAARFMESGAEAVICVLDASNLERNLRLAFELSERGLPLIYALNLVDVAERQGITVNAKLLAQELGAPVIETVAVKKQGLDLLTKELEAVLKGGKEKDARCGGACAACPSCPSSDNASGKQDTGGTRGKLDTQGAWRRAKETARRVIQKSAASPRFIDKLGQSLMNPWPGIPAAALTLVLLIGFVVGAGKALRALLLLPLVNKAIVPFFRNLFTKIFLKDGLPIAEGQSFIEALQGLEGHVGMILNILVGEYGIFVISFEWILALVIPYVFLFYVAFSFLEDSGYLPRLSILFDNVMSKMGAQGGSLIQVMMGFGCAVPAIIGTRTATSRKERIVVSTAVCVAIPCISQTGAIITLFSAYAWWMLPAMILFMLALFFTAMLVTSKFTKGKVDPLLIEAPNLLMPTRRSYVRKLGIRMKHFLVDAEAPMLVAVVIAAVLKETGAIDAIAASMQFLVSGWLGLPPEGVIGLILGIVRREMAVAPLLALDLTALQAFVAGVVSLMYLPCLSVFGILVQEFKLRIATTIVLSTTILAIVVGGIINHVVRLFL